MRKTIFEGTEYASNLSKFIRALEWKSVRFVNAKREKTVNKN